ncbi:hypothetical protein [Pseudarthrobacter sp. J47]|uniref:hypothetical protein n=1 Tax=Pseudarthrobacter sp. J47 TaxID=3116482 RepID=UPI002E815ECA|nr:hypothetical protein [Pseudarthrobacter sp. J47]MEE2523305.1 hypothetical protein [Pseudarthrobacter sp. J47]
MTVYIAIADRTSGDARSTFQLETARIGIVRRGHVYTYLPNDSSWIYNEAVERDYFADRSKLLYQEIPAPLARSLAICMRPVNPLVSAMLLERPHRFPKIPFGRGLSLRASRDLTAKRKFIAKWISDNQIRLPEGVTSGSTATSSIEVSNFQREKVVRNFRRLNMAVSSIEKAKKGRAIVGRRTTSDILKFEDKPLAAFGPKLLSRSRRAEETRIARDDESSPFRRRP